MRDDEFHVGRRHSNDAGVTVFSDQLPKQHKKKWLALLFGVVVSIAAGALFFRGVSLDELALALGRLRGRWLAIAVVALGADYAVRSWRWTVMLREYSPTLRVAQVAPAFMASIALNNVLPFRAGDAARALIFPARLGIGRSFAAATLVLERLLDLIFVLLLLATGLFLAGDRLEQGSLHKAAGFGALLASAGAVAVFTTIFTADRLQQWLEVFSSSRTGLPARLARTGSQFFGSVNKLQSRRMWTRLLPLSALCWTLEAAIFWAVLTGLGLIDVGADAAVLGSLGTLATLLPSTPGYVGTFHLAVQQSATLLGHPPGIGSSVAILSHAILWVGTTVVGLVGLFRLSAASNNVIVDPDQ
jgi:uncharacterized protein (TIRG00374 family)